MTYDELLAKLTDEKDYEESMEGWSLIAWPAIFAVVELHKPAFATVDGVKGPEWCYQCSEGRGYAKWPCTTIQAIERALEHSTES